MTSSRMLILYVDDEWPNRVVFEQSFSDLFEIRCVASGKEALDVLDAEAVAVLVTDQRMPEMTGMELLQAAKERWPATVRMVVTAYSDLDPILTAVNEGLVARYVIKPWEHDQIRQILTWGVEAYRLGAESSALQLRLMRTERLVTLGSVAAALVHDLRQPITYLSYNADRLGQLQATVKDLIELKAELIEDPTRREEIAELATELPEIIDDMRVGCSFVVDIIANMMRLIRPTDGPANTPLADPTPPLRYSMSLATKSLAGRRTRVVYDGPDELPKVRIDPSELLQVLLNLVTNAVHAVSDGGGGRVVVGARIEDDGVSFSVADDGAGMTPEVLERLGEMFYTTKDGRTGLGVAQCHRIVEKSGATLTFQSQPGAGTTASFKLPTS